MVSYLPVKLHPSKEIYEGRKKSKLEAEFEGDLSLNVTEFWKINHLGTFDS